MMVTGDVLSALTEWLSLAKIVRLSLACKSYLKIWTCVRMLHLNAEAKYLSANKKYRFFCYAERFFNGDCVHRCESMNFTSLTLTGAVHPTLESEVPAQFLPNLMARNRNLRVLTLRQYNKALYNLSFDTLVELNLWNSPVEPRIQEIFVSSLQSAPRLRHFRSVNSLFVHKRSDTESRRKANALMPRLTHLETLHLATGGNTLFDQPLDFSALTRLKRLVFDSYETSNDGKYDQKEQAIETLFDRLWALHPPHLRQRPGMPPLIYDSACNSRSKVDFYTTPLHSLSLHCPSDESMLACIQAWRRAGLGIDFEDSDGCTALMNLKRFESCTRSFREFLAAGADPFHRSHGLHGANLLFLACRHVRASKLLEQLLPLYLERYLQTSDSQLFFDALGRNLFMQASTPALRVLLRFASKPEYISLLNLKHRSHDGRNILHWARSSYAFHDETKVLLEHGVDPLGLDYEGKSPIWSALSESDAQAAITLVESFKSRKDFEKNWIFSGTTLLMRACQIGCANLVKCLIKRCTPDQIYQKDGLGRSFHNFAFASENHVELSRVLRASHRLDLGTALHSAILNPLNPIDLVKAAIRQVDVDAADHLGRTVLHLLFEAAETIGAGSFRSLSPVLFTIIMGRQPNLAKLDKSGRVPLHWVSVALRPSSASFQITTGEWQRHDWPSLKYFDAFLEFSREYIYLEDRTGRTPLGLLQDEATRHTPPLCGFAARMLKKLKG